jgi:hypothetical protein
VDRIIVLRAIAVGFFLYALYTASFLPGMLVAPMVPMLLIGTIAKTVLAFACAVGIWTGRPWAPTLVVLIGIVIAVLWLVYGFVLGIVAYLYGIAMAVTAVLLTLIMAAYIRGAPSSRVV